MALSLHQHAHLRFTSSSFVSTTISCSSCSTPSRISVPVRSPSDAVVLSIREACDQGDLKQAFRSLTSSTLTCAAQAPAQEAQEALSAVLELCASKKALEEGQQIHARVAKSCSPDDDGFLSTKLLFMYGKCGQLRAAEQLFDGMPRRSIFAWNALLGAYSSNGCPSRAAELYLDMRMSGLLPDACTFASVLKACGLLEDLYVGREIHGLAIKLGLSSVTFVVNALLAMYSRCGQLGPARLLFQSTNAERDVVSWNSIISACLQNGQFLWALSLFSDMQKTGVSMNSYTAVGVLQACAEISLLQLGMQIHASLLKCERKLEIYEYNALVVLYARCGEIDLASKVFHEIDIGEIDNVSWNSMLSAYVQNSLYEEALEFFRKMLYFGFKPDMVSLISTSSALGRLGNLFHCMELHAYALKHVFDCELQVGNTLMDMYTRCCLPDYAERLFHKMHVKDCISWSTMMAAYVQKHHHLDALDLFRHVHKEGIEMDSMLIGSILQVCSGLACLSIVKEVHCYAIRCELLDLVLENTILDVYGECGHVASALCVFQKIENKDVISWTSMISCYARNGLLSEALSLFMDMETAEVEPDAVSLVTILDCAGGLSSLSKGKEIHGFLVRGNFLSDGAICSSLVNMYARCGSIESSFRVFDCIRCKDLVLWTTAINASGMHGRGKEAIDQFAQMREMGIIPDHITFLALLYACSHSGFVNEGKHYLKTMKAEYGLEPWPEHYACVVDLLGRSGRTEEAFQFVKSMPIEPAAAIWCALLGACKVHQDYALSKVAAEKLLQLEPENPGNYVLVSNAFAAMGKWKDVDVIRERMKNKGLQKDPACSWIEVGNKVHTFLARDSSHKESVEIYSKLAEITQKLKRKGRYFEDTTCVLHQVAEEKKIEMLHGHSERLAIAFGLLHVPMEAPIRITKNLRVCDDCHEYIKLVSKFYDRDIIMRDANRFHHFKDGVCSCKDFW